MDELFAIPGNRIAIRNLIDQISGAGISVFAGPGVSQGAGLPHWQNFLGQIAKRAKVYLDELTPENIIKKTGEMYVLDAIEEVFGNLVPEGDWVGPLRLIPLLTDFVATPNVDRAIELEFARNRVPFATIFLRDEKMPASFQRPAIWKIRGTVAERQSLKGTDEDDIESSLEAFLVRPALFLGFEADELQHSPYMDALEISEQVHYAVVPAAEFDPKPFSTRDIRVVQVPVRFDNGGELLLRHVIEQTPHVKRPALHPTSVAPQATDPPEQHWGRMFAGKPNSLSALPSKPATPILPPTSSKPATKTNASSSLEPASAPGPASSPGTSSSPTSSNSPRNTKSSTKK
ncbi:MAG: hypothetical protein QM767_28110 [Anaeromyxobacter sp.]